MSAHIQLILKNYIKFYVELFFNNKIDFSKHRHYGQYFDDCAM